MRPAVFLERETGEPSEEEKCLRRPFYLPMLMLVLPAHRLLK